MSNHKPKKLKLVQAGYESYTGPIGPYEFVDGVTVDAVPLVDRDRLAAAFQLHEIDDDGAEQPAGVAHRLLAERAEIAAAELAAASTLRRMTEEEKFVEDITQTVGGTKIRHMHSREALEKIADDGGIQNLRLVAGSWKVRSKSIPALIELILKAQESYSTVIIDELVKKGADPEALKPMFALKDEIVIPEPEKPKVDAEADTETVDADLRDPEKVTTREATTPESEVKPDALADAAASGDLSAALNTGE